MAAPHIPDLDAIRGIKNPEIKFYAVVGALISLDARLESAYFHVFEKATQLKQSAAAAVFYKIKGTLKRRERTDAAMRKKLAGRPELTEWTALYTQMKSRGGHRNLVGHNVVQKEVTHKLAPSGFGGSGYGFGPLGMELGRVILEEPNFLVSEDQLQVLAGTRKPKKADFDSLFNACNALVGILNDLDALLNRL
jgi:hypothetical protein